MQVFLQNRFLEEVMWGQRAHLKFWEILPYCPPRGWFYLILTLSLLSPPCYPWVSICSNLLSQVITFLDVLFLHAHKAWGWCVSWGIGGDRWRWWRGEGGRGHVTTCSLCQGLYRDLWSTRHKRVRCRRLGACPRSRGSREPGLHPGYAWLYSTQAFIPSAPGQPTSTLEFLQIAVSGNRADCESRKDMWQRYPPDISVSATGI